MNKLLFAGALLGATVSLAAQNCAGAPAQQTFSNRQDFAASFYYNLAIHFFDLNVQTPIAISGLRTWLYDQGVGNPPVPNQVGNTATVEVYTCPTSRLGNETNAPTNPGSPWTLLGTGTITVVDTGVGNGESPTVFNPPLALPAGQYGVAVRYLAPTTGQNPGPLHCLGVSPNPNQPVSDPYLTFSNDSISGIAWGNIGVDSPNLRIIYTPAANSAQYVQFGDGCYFRPQAFYENFPNSATGTPDLSNTAFTMLNQGNSYLVIPTSSSIITPTGAPVNASPTGSSSSGNWDDALSTPITLPFTFNYPGGSTTDITISSNGFVFLANVVNSTYGYCGASYGSIAPFRDNPARIAAYFHDLDPGTGGTGAGDIYYEVDPSNQFVRITWLAVQEWGVPGALNTMQVTLYSGGNVDVAYGALANRSGANNAIAGFTPGNGSRLPTPIDISASLPYQAGDGSIPPVLGMDARPVIGTSPKIITTNVTPGTFLQALVISFGAQTPGLALDPFGAPGCFGHISLPLAVGTLFNGITPNNTFEQTFGIPNNPTLQNVQFFCQAAPLTAGLNAAGFLTSNGLCIKVGQ